MSEDPAEISANRAEREKLKLIPVDDLLVAIKNGDKIDLEGADVQGDLDINKLELERDEDGFTRIDSSIRIVNSNINGATKLNKAIFRKSIVFSGTKFEGDASFEFSIFEKLADFSSAIFNADATFWQARFQ